MKSTHTTVIKPAWQRALPTKNYLDARTASTTARPQGIVCCRSLEEDRDSKSICNGAHKNVAKSVKNIWRRFYDTLQLFSYLNVVFFPCVHPQHHNWHTGGDAGKQNIPGDHLEEKEEDWWNWFNSSLSGIRGTFGVRNPTPRSAPTWDPYLIFIWQDPDSDMCNENQKVMWCG